MSFENVFKWELCLLDNVGDDKTVVALPAAVMNHLLDDVGYTAASSGRWRSRPATATWHR